MNEAFATFPHLAANLYQRPEHYAGETFYGTATLYGRHRDSDLLVQSNWETFLSELSEAIEAGHVRVTCASHWAVGWVETIRLEPTAPEAVKATAERLLVRLEDYPSLDDSRLSELEFEAALEYWDGWVTDPEKPDIQGRLRLIADWNKRNAHIPRRAVPFLAARHSMHTLSERFPDFEQWIHELARE